MSSRKQHQQSHQLIHKLKTHIYHSFRPPNDVHIQQFSFYSKLSKSRAFEKLALSIVENGGHVTCITSIAFTINARQTRGLFAMKCITICSDMNIQHFKHRFIYTNNTYLIQITFKLNMRFFFLSVYIHQP